jgi:hypothetical protein
MCRVAHSGIIICMISEAQLDSMDPRTRAAVQPMLELITFKQALIDKLTHEVAGLRRLKYAASSERHAASCAPEQKSLLDETLDTDLAEVNEELRKLGLDTGEPEDAKKPGKKKPRREPLPAHLPRTDISHEPADTTCGCGTPMRRIGEDVSEKLDYIPGVFTVERHVRGNPGVGAPAPEVGLPALRAPGASTGARTRDRQGHPDGRAPGPGAGRQVPRPYAAVSPGGDLRARGHAHRALDAGAMGGSMRCAAAAARGGARR